MKSFVELYKYYEDDNRSIDNLRSVYDNSELLYSSLKRLISPHLSKECLVNKKILLKPNFVKQCKNPDDDICLFTHPKFILATLKILLESSPSYIVIGDAPIQDCHWEEMLPDYFYEGVKSLSEEYNVPIKVVDFRKVIFDPQTNQFGRSKRTDDDYLIFDVGEKSWLEPITKTPNQFRVTNYNPDRMALSHGKGKHQYCVAKEVFDADIVITMPKTKTHRMACLTNSLKILVGINGDKDYLPHHRLGSTEQGGDCYKKTHFLRTLSERLIDFANRHRGGFYYLPLRYLIAVMWRLSLPTKEYSMNAGWYGNDTVWRMVMDLNIIALYGKLDGTLADRPQRTLYTLCDGIVGGQKSGPLEPEPLPLGIAAFSNDAYLMDEIAGYLFGLNISKVPLLREAGEINKNKECELKINGEVSNRDDFKKLSVDVELAPGWINYDNA